MTSVALLVAEELDVEWSKVQAVFADPNRHLRNNKEYIDMSTHGSMLVRLSIRTSCRPAHPRASG